MTASLDSLALARRITEHAYRAGASLVTTLFTDDEATTARYHLAPDQSFDHAAKWLYDGMAAAFSSGAARLAITGTNPALLSVEDAGEGGAHQSRGLARPIDRRWNHHPTRDRLGDRGKCYANVGGGHVP